MLRGIQESHDCKQVQTARRKKPKKPNALSNWVLFRRLSWTVSLLMDIQWLLIRDLCNECMNCGEAFDLFSNSQVWFPFLIPPAHLGILFLKLITKLSNEIKTTKITTENHSIDLNELTSPFRFEWEDISNTRDIVSSAIKTSQPLPGV